MGITSGLKKSIVSIVISGALMGVGGYVMGDQHGKSAVARQVNGRFEELAVDYRNNAGRIEQGCGVATLYGYKSLPFRLDARYELQRQCSDAVNRTGNRMREYLLEQDPARVPYARQAIAESLGYNIHRSGEIGASEGAYNQRHGLVQQSPGRFFGF